MAKKTIIKGRWHKMKKNSNEPFLFSSTGHKLLPNNPSNTKYYVIDQINANNILFIARSKFSDSLILGSSDFSSFIVIYTTRITERIYNASALPSKKWFLIVLLRFGDGIDPRPSYRSIFVTNQNNQIIELPVSTRTFSPQSVSWAYSPDNPVFLHSTFKGTIRTFEFSYDELASYKISFRRVHEGYTWFSAGTVGSIPHTYMIQVDQNGSNCVFTDRTKTDLYPKMCPLPSNLCVNSQSEFKVFSSPYRRSNMQLPTQRCIIHASPSELTVILPFSPKKFSIPIDYLTIPVLKPGSDASFICSSDLNIAKITINPLDVAEYPATKLPFVYYQNELCIIGAPYGYLTCFLIDHADRVRACFRAQIPESCYYIHTMSILTETGTHVMQQKDGGIFECDLNPLFFIEKDHRFVLPILHSAIGPKNVTINSLAKFINLGVLKTFWNCEVYSEALLLLFNSKYCQRLFCDKICSTFCNSNRYSDLEMLFTEFAERLRPDMAEICHSFSDIEKRVPKSLIDSLPPPYNDINCIFDTLVDLLNDDFFKEDTIEPDSRFASWLQITALKHSLTKTKSIQSHVSNFPKDTNELITQVWAMRDMIPLEEKLLMPEEHKLHVVDNYHPDFQDVNRIWWFLRSQKVKIVLNKEEKMQSSIFFHVEQATGRTNDSASNFFSVHQYLLGLEMNQPIFDF